MGRKYAAIGQSVRVVIPKQFLRCGYPLSIKDIMNRDYESIEADFRRIFAALEQRPEPEPVVESDNWGVSLSPTAQPSASATVHGMMCAAIAAYRLEKEGFGGKTRSIVETDLGVFEKDQIWVVQSKAFVKTGTRYAGHCYTDSYTGETDYEPGGLEDERTHCVYKVARYGRKSKILAANCEVINEK